MDLDRLSLYRFQTEHALHVASWVQSTRELFFLAPSIRFPLTPEKVLTWSRNRRGAFVMCDRDDRGHETPCAYGEVNVSRHAPRECWLGHLIVAPAWRGRGVGSILTRRLVDRAYEMHNPHKIVLVVFPENGSAIRCYLNCGFTRQGYEGHRFGTSTRRYHMLRMEYCCESMTRLPSSPMRSIRAVAG